MEKSQDKLLVVEASIQSSDLISYWLAREGFTSVYTADNGLNALAKAELIEPDIIIVNVDLPDISGFDLCKRVKGDMPYVLVLCISHTDSEINRVRAMEVGADDYMETGDNAQFLFKIRSLLRLKQLGDQIRNQYAELEERNKLIERHLRLGRRFQRALIPDVDTRFGDCNMMSRYLPAMGVGGDFYNVMRLNDDCIGIVMGDVSGHGIAASFLTVTLNVMIKNLSDHHFNPGELLHHLNNEMCAMMGQSNDDPDLYACVFYAVIDMQDKRIRFANAGLVLPFLVEGLENIAELDISGAPIGLMQGTLYEQRMIRYHKGDMLLLYTDGLQDCYYKNQPEEFIKQVKDLFSALSPDEDTQDILDTICRYFYKADVTEHERMEMDDVSMLLCRF